MGKREIAVQESDGFAGGGSGNLRCNPASFARGQSAAHPAADSRGTNVPCDPAADLRVSAGKSMHGMACKGAEDDPVKSAKEKYRAKMQHNFVDLPKKAGYRANMQDIFPKIKKTQQYAA